MARSPHIPKYRRHSSGQARVTLNGKDHLLGPYGSAASKEAYERLLAEWLSSPAKQVGEVPEFEGLTINQLILAYWKFARQYYGFDTGRRRGDYYCLRDALKIVRSVYGRTPAKDFGPLALKACRQKMIEKDWSRRYINAEIDRVRRMFRWGGEEELVPGSVYQDLRAVSSLRRGKTEARETKKVRPVPQEDIDAALPFMLPVVATMVRLQLLSGCRPDEVCVLRPMDLDRSDPQCWVYLPGSDQGQHGAHKTAYHEHDRLILLGPKAQEVLRPYLDIEPTAYCFSPARSESQRNFLRRTNRKSPMTPSQKARRPKTRRLRAPSNRYDTHSYRRAIARACRMADQDARRKTLKEDPTIPTDRVFVPTWSPNRLRHNRATELRPYGLDVAKTVLGHSKVETTLIYAEKDLRAAKEVVAKTG
jgi:integrase